jgi:very-short-patch-repair endonuclease
MKKYSDMTDNEKKTIINNYYNQQNKSFQQIADTLQTYANKIRRDAIKFKIPIRDKSEAQKNALNTGSHKHPTKGTVRSEDTKQKIGKGLIDSWENLTSQELEDRKQKSRDQWNSLSREQQQNMIGSAIKAVRASSKHGSKLEKYLLSALINNGYRVDFHKEQILSNTKLQIDIFIPNLNLAIEVDGPSHFEPVWGEDALNKNIKYDNKKTGLLLGKGAVLIRIKQIRDYSPTRAKIIWDNLKSVIEQIENKFPDIDNRLIIIEDN